MARVSLQYQTGMKEGYEFETSTKSAQSTAKPWDNTCKAIPVTAVEQ